MVTHQYIVKIEEDPKTGELILPLPFDMISHLGWDEGTKIFWVDNKDGTFTITDKNYESSKI